MGTEDWAIAEAGAEIERLEDAIEQLVAEQETWKAKLRALLGGDHG